MKKLNLIGKVFGKLTVDRLVGIDKHGHSIWSCLCACGNSSSVMGDHLVRGNTNSCGCGQGKFTHGMHKSPEYHAYMHAKSRCDNPNTKQYESYGGRGIKFKFSNFEEFLEAVGPRPKNRSLDRIDNDGHYEAGNIKWSTRKEQSLNTRMSINKLMRTIAWG